MTRINPSRQPVSYDEVKGREGVKTHDIENEGVHPTLQDTFDQLLQNYLNIVRRTEGGVSIQLIDQSYDKLRRFANENPEFGSQLPERVRFSHQGMGLSGSGSSGCAIL